MRWKDHIAIDPAVRGGQPASRKETEQVSG